MTGPAGRTPFIGRERELDALTVYLDAAGNSWGGVFLIAGEPGIGKTRLAERRVPAVTDDMYGVSALLYFMATGRSRRRRRIRCGRCHCSTLGLGMGWCR